MVCSVNRDVDTREIAASEDDSGNDHDSARVWSRAFAPCIGAKLAFVPCRAFTKLPFLTRRGPVTSVIAPLVGRIKVRSNHAG